MSTYEAASLIISIGTFLLGACFGLIAWGRMQQWKDHITETVKDIKDRLDKGDDYLRDGELCLEDIKELKGKLFSADGSPTYITKEMCKMQGKYIKESLSVQISTIKELVETRNRTIYATDDSIKDMMQKILSSVEKDRHMDQVIHK